MFRSFGAGVRCSRRDKKARGGWREEPVVSAVATPVLDVRTGLGAGDLGYMSRTIQKFRTDKFDTKNKRKF